MQSLKETMLLLAVLATGLGCEREVDEAYVTYQLIDENQARCYSLANDVATAWAESLLGSELTSISLSMYYLNEGAAPLAATSEANAQIRALMPEIDRSKSQDVISVLFDAYSLNQSMCGLATNPEGRSLLVFTSRKSELQDDYAAAAAKLDVLLDRPSKVTLEALEGRRSVIEKAEQVALAEQGRREAESKERERVREEVTREALQRRRKAEQELREQELEQRLADAAAREGRRHEEEEAHHKAVEEQRQREAEELERREQAAAQRRRQIQSEMRRWHPTYLRAMEPLRNAVGEVNDAWSRPTVDAKPVCRRLSEVLRATDRDRLLASPDAALNSRLRAMLDGFEKAGQLCESGARFQAEAQLKEAVQQWGAAGTILRNYSLQP